MSEINISNLVMLALAQYEDNIGLVDAKPVDDGKIVGSLSDGSTFEITVVQRG
jgi:hypothetical protein